MPLSLFLPPVMHLEQGFAVTEKNDGFWCRGERQLLVHKMSSWLLLTSGPLKSRRALLAWVLQSLPCSSASPRACCAVCEIRLWEPTESSWLCFLQSPDVAFLVCNGVRFPPAPQGALRSLGEKVESYLVCAAPFPLPPCL